jgi:hypothetical protein
LAASDAAVLSAASMSLMERCAGSIWLVQAASSSAAKAIHA